MFLYSSYPENDTWKITELKCVSNIGKLLTGTGDMVAKMFARTNADFPANINLFKNKINKEIK